MEMITSLLPSIFEIAIDKWKDNAKFKTFRQLAHERIIRELFWNKECLSSKRIDEQAIYLSLLKTNAFDELVNAAAPLDEIFSTLYNVDKDINSKYMSLLLKKRLQGITRLSELIDRTYIRIHMLRHRIDNNLSKGDMHYVRQLTALTHREAKNTMLSLQSFI